MKGENVKTEEKIANKSENKKKNKGLKIAIIVFVIILVLIGAGIGGFFWYQSIKQNESTGTTWGDTYYAYLKEGIGQEEFSDKEKYGIQQNMKNTTLKFCEIDKEEPPVMVMNYEENDTNYVNVYRIDDSGKVINVSYKEPSTVELLYNIELKQYIWYVHVEKANEDLYQPIILENSNNMSDDNNDNNSIIENNISNSTDDEIKITEDIADITIEKDEETTIETLDGETISISKFDEIFIKPEIDGSVEVSINFSNIDDSNLKDIISKIVNGYKTEDEIVTEEIKNIVDEKVNQVETTKQEIEDAKEEIEKKEEEDRKKAEEEKKKAEEEAKKEAKKNNTSSSGKISEKQAKKLAQKIDGTHSDETGYDIGYTFEAMIRDSSGTEYYLFRVMWLVENSHWSTIDGIAISVDGKKWKKVDIYQNYQDGDTMQEIYTEGTF